MTDSHHTSELPKGWAWTELKEIAIEINSGFPSGRWKRGAENGVPHLRPMNIDTKGKIDLADVKYVQAEGYDALSKGDVVFNNTNSPELLGKTAYIREDTNWAYSNHMTRIRFVPSLMEPAFIGHYLHFLFRNGYFKTRCVHHVNQASIGKDFLSRMRIPFPPSSEQKRVVTKLGELFACLDAGVEGLRKVKAQLKRYRQAVLKYAFEGKLTEEWRKTHKDQLEPATKLLEKITQERLIDLEKNKKLSPIGSFELPALPEGWIWTRVDWLCDVQTGPFGTQLHRDDYTSSGIPTIEIGDVHPTRDLREGTAHFIAKEKAIELKRFEVKHGDVLFSRVGTVGRCTIVPEGCDGWIMSTSLIRVRIVSKYLLSKHLLFYFWSPIAQGFAKRTSKGTTRAGTNSRIVGELPLIIPHVMEQQIIVEEIERRLTGVDNIEQTLNQNLTRASRLRQSILKIAFQGKLVPQDPSDEPAEKLLERIREGKAKSKGEKDTNSKNKSQLELSTYVK